jgi:hypothetical protein
VERDRYSSERDPCLHLIPDLEPIPSETISINRDLLSAEFSDLLGSVNLISEYLAQLTRTKFIISHDGVIQAGPLLSLVADERELTEELRRELLISVLKREKRSSKRN